MKVYVVEAAGGPFRAMDVPRSPVGHGQVLVKICASGVNPLDTKIRAGAADHARQPLPAVLGLDMAGTVERTGPDVTAFQPGDAVFGMVGGVGGLQGTLAEYVVADAELLAPKPNTLTMREAAALPLVTITAWEGLVDRARVRAGQTVLIHAGVGGVGYAAVEIALAHGAKTFATVSADKRAIVEGLGAVPIDRYAPVEKYVALAPLSFRAATYSGVFTLLPLLTGLQRAHHGDILRKAAGLATKNQLKPLLNEQRFGPDDIANAFDAVLKGGKGKVVVEF